MVKIDLDKLLHQRIIDKCQALYEDGHFPQAALEAMKQVEQALKEKAEIEERISRYRGLILVLCPKFFLFANYV